MKGNIVVAANLNSTEVRKTHFIIIDYIYTHAILNYLATFMMS